MLENRELAAPGSVMGTGIESLDPDVPLDLSKYATAELKLAVDLDHYAVRDEAYRRSERLVKRLATAEKRVSDLHQELKECGLAIDAASKQATAEQNRTAPNA
jgi:predicted dinucleotide-utilizing enzyme